MVRSHCAPGNSTGTTRDSRQPGSREMAFVIDPVKFGATSRRSGGRDVQAPVSTLADSGWQSVVVGPHTDVAAAWAAMAEVTGVGGSPR